MYGDAAIGMFCAICGADNSTRSNLSVVDIVHVAILATGNLVVGLRSDENILGKRSQAFRTALRAVSREHELREGTLNMIIGIGSICFRSQRSSTSLTKIC